MTERQCSTQYQEQCEDVTSQQCRTEQQQVCYNVPEEECTVGSSASKRYIRRFVITEKAPY